MHGFARLIEKDWLGIGHRFSDRLRADSLQLGQKPPKADQVSPVFLQFIECVWQLTEQYPFAFEFGESFLIDLYQEAMIGRFGTFLYNSDEERQIVVQRCQSLWRYLLSFQDKYRNPFYEGEKSTAIDPLSDMPSEKNFGRMVQLQSEPKACAVKKNAAKISATTFSSKERIVVQTRSAVSQQSMLGGLDSSQSVSCVEGVGRTSSSDLFNADGSIIVPYFQPHSLHIWYGFFQRYAQGLTSMAPSFGVPTGDAFILSLSNRISAMDEEIRSLKLQLREMKMSEEGKTIDMFASLEERTRNPVSNESMIDKEDKKS